MLDVDVLAVRHRNWLCVIYINGGIGHGKLEGRGTRKEGIGTNYTRNRPSVLQRPSPRIILGFQLDTEQVEHYWLHRNVNHNCQVVSSVLKVYYSPTNQNYRLYMG